MHIIIIVNSINPASCQPSTGLLCVFQPLSRRTRAVINSHPRNSHKEPCEVIGRIPLSVFGIFL